MMAMMSVSQSCGSMALSLAVPIMEYMKAARWPPRSEPAKSQDFRPRATPLRGSFGGIVRQANPPIAKEFREARPVARRQQIVDGLGHLGVFGQECAFAPQPALEIFDQRGRDALSGLQPIGGCKSVDAALDIEQGIDAPDGFKGDG